MKKYTFTPKPDHMAKKPEVSGNDINGLGEASFRNPSLIYWAEDPTTIPHGEMQLWFYTHNTGEELQKARDERALISTIKDSPVAPLKLEVNKGDATALIKEQAKKLGAADCGITAVDPAWAFEGKSISTYPNVVVLALAQDYDAMNTAPENTAGAEVVKIYGEGYRASHMLANWIRERGYQARASAGPTSGDFTMIPAALRAGLGELGKHGSVIHPKLGSNFRLACVLTDMPLELDIPTDFGADGFCSNCQICMRACPVDAIFPDKKLVRGMEKYYVDFDKCIPFFNEHAGCGVCMIACPWSRPGVADKMRAKLAKKR